MLMFLLHSHTTLGMKDVTVVLTSINDHSCYISALNPTSKSVYAYMLFANLNE